jgi:hypothetical protein
MMMASSICLRLLLQSVLGFMMMASSICLRLLLQSVLGFMMVARLLLKVLLLQSLLGASVPKLDKMNTPFGNNVVVADHLKICFNRLRVPLSSWY